MVEITFSICIKHRPKSYVDNILQSINFMSRHPVYMVEMSGKSYFDLDFWDYIAHSLESWIQSEASQVVVIEASLMLGL